MRRCVVAGFLLVSILWIACDSPSSVSGKGITNVNDFLARVCEGAAACPDISPTPADIEACPGQLTSKVSSSQMSLLQQFTSYPKARQDCILACMEERICDRFGVGLASISDSDLMETYSACVNECPE